MNKNKILLGISLIFGLLAIIGWATRLVDTPLPIIFPLTFNAIQFSTMFLMAKV